MPDIVLGLLGIGVGLMLCFRGYVAIRILLPVWGAFVGFGIGVGAVSAVTGDDVLDNVLAWFAGLGLALLFAVIAYTYYEVAVVLTMAAAGFVLGTSLLVAFGVEWNWVLVLGGVALGVCFGILAVVADLPMVLLTFLTATAGAATTVTGIMLLTGAAESEAFDQQVVVASFDTSGWWWLLYVGLAIAGIVAQFSFFESMTRPIREEWEAAGGRAPSHRPPSPPS